MKRRDVLKYTALATGTILSAPLISGILTGCRSEVEAINPYQPIFFKKQEFGFVKQLVDIILPKTDSSSAPEVGVQNILDTMIGSVYEPADQLKWQENFLALLLKLNSDPEDLTFKNVSQNITLENIENLRTQEYENEAPVKAAIKDLRQQTIAKLKVFAPLRLCQKITLQSFHSSIKPPKRHPSQFLLPVCKRRV